MGRRCAHPSGSVIPDVPNWRHLSCGRQGGHRKAPIQAPPPTLADAGNRCAAVVAFDWDLDMYEQANRVLWELKRGNPFSPPDGRDPSRLDFGTGPVSGGAQVDLRDYGAAFNSNAPYRVRIVPKSGNQDLALRSEALEIPLPFLSGNEIQSHTSAEPCQAAASASAGTSPAI